MYNNNTHINTHMYSVLHKCRCTTVIHTLKYSLLYCPVGPLTPSCALLLHPLPLCVFFFPCLLPLPALPDVLAHSSTMNNVLKRTQNIDIDICDLTLKQGTKAKRKTGPRSFCRRHRDFLHRHAGAPRGVDRGAADGGGEDGAGLN